MNKVILVGVWGCLGVACGSDPRSYASPIGGDGGLSESETSTETAGTTMGTTIETGPEMGSSMAETPSRIDSDDVSTLVTTGGASEDAGGSESGPGGDVSTTTAPPESTSADGGTTSETTTSEPPQGSSTPIDQGTGSWRIGGSGQPDDLAATVSRVGSAVVIHTDTLVDATRTFIYDIQSSLRVAANESTGLGFWVCGVAGAFSARVTIYDLHTNEMGNYERPLAVTDQWVAVRVPWGELTSQGAVAFSAEFIETVGFATDESNVSVAITGLQFLQGESPLVGAVPEGNCPALTNSI